MIIKALPATNTRVARATSADVNRNIRLETESRLRELVQAGPAAIDKRLVEINYEWDIERTLEANAASISLVGLLLGVTVDRRYNIIPKVVATFLLQHALRGWCPPVPILRKMGVRTAKEINEERMALKAIRGDFDQIASGNTGANQLQEVLKAIRK